MCTHCVEDGHVSRATYDLIERFVDEWPDAAYGPAHIVLDDLNLEDGHIQWCLTLTRAALSGDRAGLSASDVETMNVCQWYRDRERDELTATIGILEELLRIPQDAR